MPYPDTEPTADEIEQNPQLKRELFEAFNNKPKDAIARIKDICSKQGLDETAQRKSIAAFLLHNRENLNQASVGDYLSGPDPEHAEVLNHFATEYAPKMKGQTFTQGLRGYLGNFEMPGEAQKIDRLVNAFGKTYMEQNPECGIANGEAAYILSFQAIMLASDAHNPAVKNKMTMDGLKANLRGYNGKKNFDEGFLKEFYRDLTTTNLGLRAQKVEPGFELESGQLRTDRTLGRLDTELGKKNGDLGKALGVEGAKVSTAQRKPWHAFLTGYKSTVTVEDGKGNKVNVEISKPGLFSRQNPSVTVKPEGPPTPEKMNLAASVTSKFQAGSKAVADFAYQREDMTTQVKQEKEGVKTESPKVKTEGPKPTVERETPKVGLEVESVGEKLAAGKKAKVGTEVIHEGHVASVKDRIGDQIGKTLHSGQSGIRRK